MVKFCFVAAFLIAIIATGPAHAQMDPGHMYLMPEGIHALENAPPAQPKTVTTTTRVCTTEGDKDNPQETCRTEVTTSQQTKPPPIGRFNDPLNAQRPGNIFGDRSQY